MALTKEAYKILNQNKDGITFIRPYSEYTLQDVINALTELDELKRDVARYFGLQYKNQFSSMTQNEIHEMYVLRDKLSKVKP